MPNLKLSEYIVKTLYSRFNNNSINFNYTNINKALNINQKDKLVAKVDDGSKRRFKRGLILLDQNIENIKKFVNDNPTKNIFVEPMVNIEKEYYLMIRNENNGSEYYDNIYFNTVGGISQMDPLNNANKLSIDINSSCNIINVKSSLKILNNDLATEIINLFNFYKKYHFTFMEINPLVKTKEGEFKAVDFAGMIDSCAIYLFDKTDQDIINLPYFDDNNYIIEKEIAKLDSMTGSSFKIHYDES